MSQPQVVFFTGPAAAGKSTVAAAWAASRSTPTAHFDQDQARFLVRGGYISRSAAHADPSLRERAEQQWLLAAAVCEAMAATYLEWGFDAVAHAALRAADRRQFEIWNSTRRPSRSSDAAQRSARPLGR